jgi:hypothetical protein
VLGGRLLLTNNTGSEPLDTARKKDDDHDGVGDWWKGLSHLTQSYIDLLHQVDITLWTDLPIPNDVAIRVIALYLNNDFPVLPLFNADLFLQDFSQSRPYFCSRLLVSALLAWACVRTPNQENDPKLTMSVSKLTLLCTPKQLPGVRSSFLTPKLNGTSWTAVNPLRCPTYLHWNSCL